jgi:hypothetical protein
MGKSIQAAASQMSNIVSAAQTKYGNNVNVAFVGYRDYGNTSDCSIELQWLS